MNPQMDTSVDLQSPASYLCWPDNSIVAVLCGCLILLLLLCWLSFHLKDKQVSEEMLCILGYNITVLGKSLYISFENSL